ncbi:MAG: hypothetical protein JWM44_2194 [Bacilli bacterium]|nr:hypothetical protein [Bacilli bacterium]
MNSNHNVFLEKNGESFSLMLTNPEKITHEIGQFDKKDIAEKKLSLFNQNLQTAMKLGFTISGHHLAHEDGRILQFSILLENYFN